MPQYVIAPPAIPAVPVQDNGLFPVRRIFCVGRNYAEHAREMGHDPNAEPPFFFSKPADALVTGGTDTRYPPATSDLHHEIELVVAIGAPGAGVAPEAAEGLVWGYAAGIDLTRRDLQAAAKKAGKPWDMAKGFDRSAVVGDIRPVASGGHPARGSIALRVNGAARQQGDLGDMIWGVPHVIAALSQLVALKPGDLIFTGTPAGVGALARGDLLEGEIEGVGRVRTRIV